MLGTEILRLLRETWKSATELAEELFVILGSPDIPITTSAPINMTKGSGTQPAMTFTGYSAGDPVLTINRGTDPPINISLGDIENLSSGGGANQPQKQTTSVFVGSVASGGPGNGPYKVILAGGKIINAFQKQIDSAETIPAGTAVIVVLSNNVFVMQVPVWLS